MGRVPSMGQGTVCKAQNQPVVLGLEDDPIYGSLALDHPLTDGLQPLQGERRAGTVTQEPLEPGPVIGLDSDRGIDRKIRRGRFFAPAPRDGGESHGRDEQKPPPLRHSAMSFASSMSR
jgi:hypothetical protein